jgi:phosphomannomutase
LLDSVIKAYDIRGVVPDQLNADFCRAVGTAFVEVLSAEGPVAGVVVGYDMRPSSPELARAFAEGVASAGVDVTVIGLASTDQLYCASGLLGLPGAMFTASHNPARYNGIKLCRAYAAPVGQESGLDLIRDLLAAGVGSAAVESRGQGSITESDMLGDYVAHLHSLVDLSAIRHHSANVVRLDDGVEQCTVDGPARGPAGGPAGGGVCCRSGARRVCVIHSARPYMPVHVVRLPVVPALARARTRSPLRYGW